MPFIARRCCSEITAVSMLSAVIGIFSMAVVHAFEASRSGLLGLMLFAVCMVASIKFVHVMVPSLAVPPIVVPVGAVAPLVAELPACQMYPLLVTFCPRT